MAGRQGRSPYGGSPRGRRSAADGPALYAVPDPPLPRQRDGAGDGVADTVLVCPPHSGGEPALLTATPAVGDEILELDSLLRSCLAAVDPDPSDMDWTAADLRSVLLPPGGGCLVVRTPDGMLAGLGSALPADELDPDAGFDPVLLVHPLYRGHRIGRWLRHRLARHLAF